MLILDLECLRLSYFMCVLTSSLSVLHSVIMLFFSGGSVWPCDFEEGFCQWFQLNDGDFNWARHKGETPSQNTGPDVDVTTGTGELIRKIHEMVIVFTPMQNTSKQHFNDYESLNRGNLAIYLKEILIQRNSNITNLPI